MISLVQYVETFLRHVQGTLKRNDVYGCILYWRDAIGEVPCVYWNVLLDQRGLCDVYYNTHGTIYSTQDLLHLTTNKNTGIP